MPNKLNDLFMCSFDPLTVGFTNDDIETKIHPIPPCCSFSFMSMTNFEQKKIVKARNSFFLSLEKMMNYYITNTLLMMKSVIISYTELKKCDAITNRRLDKS